MKRFEHLHTVSFEETNLIGNVYFANYVKWQGLCRERFLEEKAPQVLEDIEKGLALVTLNCSCKYVGELKAFDKVLICMYLAEMQQHKVKMNFEYYKSTGNGEHLVAHGTHEIGFFIRREGGLQPIPVPHYISRELSVYSNA